MVLITSHNMVITKEQKKEAYEKLSPEVQGFIMDPETTDLIERILSEHGLSEDQSNLADSEILYAMYGLQNLDVAVRNIAQITGKSETEIDKLKIKLLDNIFSKIDKFKIIGGETVDIFEVTSIVNQISQKYGLNQQQQDIILQIIKDNLEKDNIMGLENEMTERLNTSKLLSEQIIIDINKRVFEQKGRVKNVSTNTTLQKEKLMSSGTQLELRPENLPMVEKNEPLKVNPVPTQPQRPVFQNEVLDKQIPIGVPRYVETTKPAYINPVIEKKINTITSTPAPAKYEKDPYREPLN